MVGKCSGLAHSSMPQEEALALKHAWDAGYGRTDFCIIARSLSKCKQMFAFYTLGYFTGGPLQVYQNMLSLWLAMIQLMLWPWENHAHPSDKDSFSRTPGGMRKRKHLAFLQEYLYARQMSSLRSCAKATAITPISRTTS